MEPVPELMMTLFKGYSSAADDDFVRYIQNKRDAYEDGAPMSVDQLMSAALNKYELKVEDNSWSVPDKKDDRIIAFEAENEKLRTEQKGHKKNKQSSNKGSSDQYAWEKVPPKSGDPQKKKVSSKWYHWCTKHLAWTIHATEACNLPAVEEGNIPLSKPSNEKLLYMNKAMKALAEESEDEEDGN
jgi:hypothetical protein